MVGETNSAQGKKKIFHGYVAWAENGQLDEEEDSLLRKEDLYDMSANVLRGLDGGIERATVLIEHVQIFHT